MSNTPAITKRELLAEKKDLSQYTSKSLLGRLDSKFKEFKLMLKLSTKTVPQAKAAIATPDFDLETAESTSNSSKQFVRH